MLLTIERTRRGWTKSELARRARLNATTVSMIESGRWKPYPVQVRKLADALDWPPSDADRLLDDEGPVRRAGATHRDQ